MPLTEQSPVAGPGSRDRRSFVSALVGEIRDPAAEGRLAPRLLAIALAVVVVAGVAVVLGVLARPSRHHTVRAGSATPSPSPAGATQAAESAPRQGNAPPAGSVPRYSGGDGASGPLNGNGVGGSGAVSNWADSSGGGNPAPPAAADRPATTARHAPARATAPRHRAVKPPAVRKAATTAKARPAFTAITGYGCAESKAKIFDQAGFYSDGVRGWLRQGKGGYGAGGCNGTYDAMPMSGSATKDDPENYALWRFRTGPVTSGSCAVRVYVPNSNQIHLVGGQPSLYSVYSSLSLKTAVKGSFSIDQVANHGRWVTAGTFRVDHGELMIKLHSRGLDFTSGGKKTYAHHAIGQVQVSCRG
jgi:hypothetical protein